MRVLDDAPVYPGDGRVTIAEHDGYWLDIVPMLYNHRLVMTPKDSPYIYDHGWCYPTLTAAMVALLSWDPDTQPEPEGFIKRATKEVRTIVTPGVDETLREGVSFGGGGDTAPPRAHPTEDPT